MKDILKIEKIAPWIISIVFIAITTLSAHLAYGARGGHVGGHTGAHSASGNHNSHSAGSKGSSSAHTSSGPHSTSNGHTSHSSSHSSVHTGENSGHHSTGTHNTHTGENSNHINSHFRAGTHPTSPATRSYSRVNTQPLTSNRILKSGLSIQKMPPLKTNNGLNSATVSKFHPKLSNQQIKPIKNWKAEPVKTKNETLKTPEILSPYKRPSGATTKKQRDSVQNKPCVDCGITTNKQHADHKTPLVKEYYQTGKIDKIKMRKIESVQPQCPTCSAKQGADMSRYSKKEKKDRGL